MADHIDSDWTDSDRNTVPPPADYDNDPTVIIDLAALKRALKECES